MNIFQIQYIEFYILYLHYISISSYCGVCILYEKFFSLHMETNGLCHVMKKAVNQINLTYSNFLCQAEKEGFEPSRRLPDLHP